MKKVYLSAFLLAIVTSTFIYPGESYSISQTNVRTELLTITTKDGVDIDGAFFSPYNEKSNKKIALLFVHGKTMNFYKCLPRFAPPVLAKKGYHCLSLNRRAHDVLSLSPIWRAEGDAIAKYEEHVIDVEAGLTYLKKEGYKDIIVVGHSLGGYLTAVTASKNESVSGIILASPIPGYITIPGTVSKKAKENLLAKVKTDMADGKGSNKYILPTWPWVISVQTASEHMRADFPTLKNVLQNIKIPILAFAGSDTAIENVLNKTTKNAIDTCSSSNKSFEIIKGSNHFYKGYEKQVTKLIAKWLKSKFPMN